MPSRDHERSSERAATVSVNNRMLRISGWIDRVVPFRDLRPLDRIPSIKLRLSILILAAVGVTLVTTTVAFLLDLKPRYGVLAAVVLALAMVQILARGLTQPVREMAEAADRMAEGDYGQHVTATSADEIGQLGRSFNQMVDQISELERQRHELIANVSHELRTPIAVLQGNLENLLDEVHTDETTQKETLAAMHRQATRLGRLVHDVLDLSRLEAAETPLANDRVDLARLLTEVLQETALRQPSPDITYVGGDLATTVVGDAERLHQVVGNVIDNAIDHGDATPIVLTLSADAGMANSATISVQDQGPGIEEDQIARVFDRYVGSSQPGSSGLGLAIAKSIVGRHHGTIAAANTNPGCEFQITLPLAGAPPSTNL